MPACSGLCNLWLMSDGMILKDGIVRTIRTASPGTILCTDIAKSWLYDHSYNGGWTGAKREGPCSLALAWKLPYKWHKMSNYNMPVGNFLVHLLKSQPGKHTYYTYSMLAQR